MPRSKWMAMNLLGELRNVGPEKLLDVQRVTVALDDGNYHGTARLWCVARGFSRLPDWLAWGLAWRSEITLERPIPVPGGEIAKHSGDQPTIDEAVRELRNTVLVLRNRERRLTASARFELCECGRHGRIVTANGIYGPEVGTQAHALSTLLTGRSGIADADVAGIVGAIQRSGLPNNGGDLEWLWRIEVLNECALHSVRRGFPVPALATPSGIHGFLQRDPGAPMPPSFPDVVRKAEASHVEVEAVYATHLAADPPATHPGAQQR